MFFSDTDETESAVPGSNGYVNNAEVSGKCTTTFAIAIYMFTKFEYLTYTCKNVTHWCRFIIEF